jgi:two-component system sensor histidine kinase KdpD
VLAAAAAWGLAYAVGVSIVSLLVFNFFYLPPVHTLSLRHPRDWTALVVYLVTGVVASELAARARRRAAEAERREREAALLTDLAARLLERGDIEELTARIGPGNARLAAAVDALLALAAERERLQEEAVDAEALRRSDAVKTAVIRSVAHDLRTPLATIEAVLDGLRLAGSDREPLLETAGLELARLERLVENLLDLSRVEAGAAVPAPALWPADALVGQALDELPGAARVDVDLRASLPAASRRRRPPPARSTRSRGRAPTRSCSTCCFPTVAARTSAARCAAARTCPSSSSRRSARRPRRSPRSTPVQTTT